MILSILKHSIYVYSRLKTYLGQDKIESFVLTFYKDLLVMLLKIVIDDVVNNF